MFNDELFILNLINEAKGDTESMIASLQISSPYVVSSATYGSVINALRNAASSPNNIIQLLALFKPLGDTLARDTGVKGNELSRYFTSRKKEFPSKQSQELLKGAGDIIFTQINKTWTNYNSAKRTGASEAVNRAIKDVKYALSMAAKTYQRDVGKSEQPKAKNADYSRHLFKRLPEIAKSLMAKYVDASDSRNRGFLDNPDSPAEHAPKWHQWGVVTHTKMFGRSYDKEVGGLLQDWGLKKQVDNHLSQTIDGRPKRDLLRAGIALHDLGKFTHRTIQKRSKGGHVVTFTDHEAKSGEIIRSKDFSDSLKQDYDLTDKQIEYIARCAELHFTLGIMRRKAKEQGQYNMAFARSPKFPNMARDLMKKHPGFELEMGLLFMGDSMAKTDIRIKVNSDEDIEARHGDVEKTLERRNLNPNLIRAVKQLPVNIEVGKRYLETWASRR